MAVKTASFLLLVLAPVSACGRVAPQGDVRHVAASLVMIQPSGTTIASRIAPPAGYHRTVEAAGSIGHYLRSLALKPDGAPVLYYDGREKPNPGIYAAVLAMDIGHEDLQQCADAVMRLHAEYLFHAGNKAAIHFHFTNGFNADYMHWMQGYRIKVSGNEVAWVKSHAVDSSYAAFRLYLDQVFRYAGTLSLARELAPVAYGDMRIGDVLIMGGSPGHAVTVLDMAVNAAGKKVYLLAQSYMPAQDIQVLENPVNKGLSPWYELDGAAGRIETPQWVFSIGDLRRFRE